MALKLFSSAIITTLKKKPIPALHQISSSSSFSISPTHTLRTTPRTILTIAQYFLNDRDNPKSVGTFKMTHAPTPYRKDFNYEFEGNSEAAGDAYLSWMFKKAMQEDTTFSKMEDMCLVMEFVGCPYTGEAFDNLIQSLVRNGKLETALQILNFLGPEVDFSLAIPSPPSPPPPLSHAIEYYDNDCKSVEMKNFIDGCVNILIQHRCRYNWYELALHEFNSMKEEEEWWCPNYRTFELLIGGLSEKIVVDKCEKFSGECIRLLDEMLKLKYRPSDVRFYQHVIPFVLKAKELDKITQLLRLMKDSGFSVYEHIANSDENEEALFYENVVVGFCNLRKFDDAVEFLRENSIPHARPYNALLGCFCDAGMFDEAIDYLDIMLKKGLVTEVSWKKIYLALARAGKTAKAFEIFQRMVNWENPSLF